ncbi:hypothetical protein GCM10018773_18990 [Streptomyces candidus]|nr:hypothetical protein GCM10018773_18990 [Streptomyces candidus]
MPVAFDTNNDRSGAPSAHSGNETRGARKRISHSGTAALLLFSPLLLIPPSNRTPAAAGTPREYLRLGAAGSAGPTDAQLHDVGAGRAHCRAPSDGCPSDEAVGSGRVR